MKSLKTIFVAILCVTGLMACNVVEVDNVSDPNNPTASVVLNNLTRGQLQNLISGLENVHRRYNSSDSDAWSMWGSFGRELYYFNTSDPNFASAWLQLPGSTMAEEQNNFFVDASVYDDPYIAVNQANLILESIQDSEVFSDQEKNAISGFAKIIKAYQLLIPLQTQFQNGIRVDVTFSEPLNPGEFLSYDAALTAIRNILSEASSELGNAGSSLPFNLSSGFAGFNTPAGLQQIANALAARAAIYAEDWQGALNALDQSFLDLQEGESVMNTGPAHIYGGGNDIFNPYFYTPNADVNQLTVVHPSMIEDTLAGDTRVDNKFFKRPIIFSIGDIGVPVQYQHATYTSATSPIPFIRNEELILIYAEAQAQLNNPTDAVNAINLVRNTWNVGDYTGPTDLNSLIDEILFQRRYSLWAEGHRWIDARRYDRFDEIPTDLDGGRVPTQLARPQGEIDWDNFTGGG